MFWKPCPNLNLHAQVRLDNHHNTNIVINTFTPRQNYMYITLLNTSSLKMFLFRFQILLLIPQESLEQIAAFDIEELLSKSAVPSENMLLHVWQSLTREWGEGFVSTLLEDFVQNLLTEVWFLEIHPLIC